MGQRTKVKLGKWSAKEVYIPDYKDLMIHPPKQSIILFGVEKNGETPYRMVFGVGTVVRISHGKLFDLVYLVFGGGRTSMRKIYVTTNKARRSVWTLTVGHIATFYGYAIGGEKTTKDGKKRFIWRMHAYGFNGWYLPRTLEIKKIAKDKQDIVEMSQEEEDEGMDLLEIFEDKEE